MVQVLEPSQEEEVVLQCNRCGGQSFLILASADGLRVIGFECLTCASREFVKDA